MAGDAWRIRYVADTPEGRRRLSETVHGSRRRAQDRLAELRCARDARGGCPTVGEVWEGEHLPFLDACIEAGTAKPATRAAYSSAWRAHVGPRFAGVPASMVTPGDVQAFLLGLSGPVASTCKAVLSNVMERAAMHGHVAANPAGGRLVMPTRRAARPKGVYSMADLGRLDDAMRGTPLEAAYLLQAHAGLRVGESLAVRAGDVEPGAGESASLALVRVSRTVGADGRMAPTKTRRARTAVVSAPWSARLVELAAGLAPGDLLTHDGFGNPLATTACRNAWHASPLPEGMERLPMRNLRNSYETYMHWELGVPIETTSRLLGHSSTAVTEAHYDRPREDALVRAVEASVAAHQAKHADA